ncbi:hypothetical protein C2845_PM07G20170 [Panicum miliaceum]|uniref:Uncharacterized protein n=1 Tax=Panicum miliaceum TaxID=4540 RepID=A0A3L6SII8_PANMI|nr:hypothetical protein C2845_PM07G20170 [Panicum miliaceum]
MSSCRARLLGATSCPVPATSALKKWFSLFLSVSSFFFPDLRAASARCGSDKPASRVIPREAGATLVDDEPRVPFAGGARAMGCSGYLAGAAPRRGGRHRARRCSRRILKAAIRRFPVAGAASSTPRFYRAVRTACAPPPHRSCSAWENVSACFRLSEHVEVSPYTLRPRFQGLIRNSG